MAVKPPCLAVEICEANTTACGLDCRHKRRLKRGGKVSGATLSALIDAKRNNWILYLVHYWS